MASCFKDKTFCASPNCKNECGRKMTDEECAQLLMLTLTQPEINMPVCYGYFCGEPENNIKSNKA